MKKRSKKIRISKLLFISIIFIFIAFISVFVINKTIKFLPIYRIDNRVENLRWVTASENQYNELTMIRKKEYKGEKCYWYEVTGKDNPFSIKVVQLSMDGELIKIWDGINETRNGRRTKHKGYRWMYYEDYIKLNGK